MIDKQVILNALRDRGEDRRADWVDKELPDEVDTYVHAGLLAMLRLDPAELVEKPSLSRAYVASADRRTWPTSCRWRSAWPYERSRPVSR